MCLEKQSHNEFLPVETFSQSLFIPFDLGEDLLEASIDLAMDNEIIKSIPIVKALVAIKDIGLKWGVMKC